MADFLDVTHQKERFRTSHRASPYPEASESDYDSEVTDDEEDGIDDEPPAQPFAQLIQSVSEHIHTKKSVLSELYPILKVYLKGLHWQVTASTTKSSTGIAFRISLLPDDIVLITWSVLDGRRTS
jgi:hypothetical protein